MLLLLLSTGFPRHLRRLMKPAPPPLRRQNFGGWGKGNPSLKLLYYENRRETNSRSLEGAFLPDALQLLLDLFRLLIQDLLQLPTSILGSQVVVLSLRNSLLFERKNRQMHTLKSSTIFLSTA